MRILTLFLVTLTCTPLWSQEGILEQYIQEGLEKNLRLNREQLLLEEQQLKVAEARGNYFPNVRFNATYLRALGGRTFEFPIGTLFNPIYSSLNDLSGNANFPTDLANQEFQLTPDDFLDARFFVTQPLYNPAIYYGYKAQQELLSVQEAQLATQKDELRKNIRVAYFNYLKSLAVQAIYDSTEVLLLETLRFNQALVRHDKATEDVVATLEYELEKLNSDRTHTQKDQAVAQAYFNTLLHRPLDATILTDSTYDTAIFQRQALNPLLDQALAARSEPQQLQRAIQANQLLTELERKSLLPTIGLELTGGYQSEGLVLESEAFLATGAVSLNWTLFEGQKRKKRIAQAQVRTQQLRQEYASVQEQIQLQVIQAWNTYIASQDQWKADRAALRSAEKSYRIVAKRYQTQQALLVEYLDAKTRLVNARISLALTTYDVHIRQSELDRALAL